MARAGTGPAELSTEVVHERLRTAILRGELDSTVLLSQVQLAARLGVSRTPLREALRMLQREGLIDSTPNRQVRVAEMSVADTTWTCGRRRISDSTYCSAATRETASAAWPPTFPITPGDTCGYTWPSPEPGRTR